MPKIPISHYSMPKIKIYFLCSCEKDWKMAYREQVETCLILYVRNTGIKRCVSVQASSVLTVTAERHKLSRTGNTEHVRHATNTEHVWHTTNTEHVRHMANTEHNNNSNNNNNNLLQLGCHPVAVVTLHVYKT